MKRLPTSVPATTQIPLEAFYSYLGKPMPELIHKAEPEFPHTVKVRIFNASALSVPPKVKYKRAISYYDGQIPFKDWLKTDYVTSEKLLTLSSLLADNGTTARIYLKRLGATNPEIVRGEMLARMKFISLEVRLAELLKEYREIKNKAELRYDEFFRFLHSFLKERIVNGETFLLDLIQSSTNPRELGLKIIACYYQIYNERKCRQKLWYLLLEKNYYHFYDMLRSRSSTSVLLGSYLKTILECLHLIDPSDPYWEKAGLPLRLQEISEFYARIRKEDYGFVLSHFPSTISIVRKKRPVNFRLLHLLWIKHKIYISAQKGLSFKKLMAYFYEYQVQSGIMMEFDQSFTDEVFLSIGRQSEMRNNRRLESMIEIHV